MKSQIYRTVNAKYDIPPEIRPVLDDFKSMVNWLVSWGIYAGRPKNPDRGKYWVETRRGLRFNSYWMCEETTEWFEKTWRPKYAAHYHEAACAVAAQQLMSWRALGGNTSSRPYLSTAQMRLRKDLFKATLEGNRLNVRVVTAPRKFVSFDTEVNHGRLNRYSSGTIGEMTLHQECLDLVFSSPEDRPRAKKNAGMDTNFDSIGIALDDKIEKVSLAKVVEIQRRYKEERKRIQRTIPKNLQRQRRVLSRLRKREHNRIEEIIYKEVIPEILAKTKGYNLAWDDLSQTNQNCIVNSKGKRFHERLSAWVHGKIQKIANDKSPYKPLRPVYTLGTSTFCPFDGSKLKHPEWGLSKCDECGKIYDRDALAAISTKVRSVYRHRKGEKWKTADEILPKRKVRALSKAALFKVLPSEGQVFPHLTNEKRDMGRSPSQDGGFPLNAASSVGRGATSLTSESESPLGEVGQNDRMALTTLARFEDLCIRTTT
jgi:transposase